MVALNKPPSMKRLKDPLVKLWTHALQAVL